MPDLVVVGPDPLYGGGSYAMTSAFIDAARALGREPELVFVPHPMLRPCANLPITYRIEPLRLLRGSRALLPTLRAARSVWVAGPLAMHGWAAAQSGRRYGVWAVTSLADERRGRLPGLSPSRKAAALAAAPALGAIERAVFRRAERVFTSGDASRAAVSHAAGIDEDRIGILPLPVDVDRFAPVSDEEWLAGLDRPVLAFVGRTDDPRKNLALALESLRLVRARVPAAKLRVIGPGLRPEGAGVEALGEVPSVADSLRDAALLLLPSRQEGFGIAAAEALASGVPVVATPSGGPEELLHMSDAGIVLDGWSAIGLADAVVALLRDTARLLSMRQRGRAYVVREHSPERLRSLVAAALSELDD